MVTNKELIEQMRANAEKRIAIGERKNSNYAGGGPEDNAFKNFDIISWITNGKVSRDIGMLVRITDKVARLGTLLTGTPDAVGESIEDSLQDLANYADLELIAFRDSQETKAREQYREVADKHQGTLEALANAEQLELPLEEPVEFPVKVGDTISFIKPTNQQTVTPSEDPKSILSRFFHKLSA